MKRVIISSLRRTENHNDGIGKIYIVDLETGGHCIEPLNIVPGYNITPKYGRSHGARGITFHKNKMYVASSAKTIYVFDINCNKLLYTHSLEGVSGIHAIRSMGDKIQIAATDQDAKALLWDDGNYEVHSIVTDIQDMVDKHITGSYVDKIWGSDRAHFNSFGIDNDGTEYHVYLGAHMLADFTNKKPMCILGPLSSPHDVAFQGNDILVNSTANSSIVAVDKTTYHARVIHEIKDYIDNGTDHNRWGWTRGLATHEEWIISGIIPVHIKLLRRNGDQCITEFSKQISMEPNEAIFDLALHPEDWR